MTPKDILILNRNLEFCLLMGHRLSRSNINTWYSESLSKGLEIIEAKRPDMIIGEKDLCDNLEELLHEKIDSMDEAYDPDVYVMSDSSNPAVSLPDEIKRIFGNRK